jgi:leucyl-tRNA synthetase
MRQWMLRITAYAERLLNGPRHDRLDRIAQGNAAQLDRPQRRRRSHFRELEGSRNLKTSPSSPLARTRCSARLTWCFRRNTNSSIKSPLAAQKRSRRADTTNSPLTKSDLERTELAKEKTGVWTGAYAINPVNQ